MSRRRSPEVQHFSLAVLAAVPSSLRFSRTTCTDHHPSRCVLRLGSHPAMPSLAARFAGGAADSLHRRPTAPTSELSGGNHLPQPAHQPHTTTALAQFNREFFLSRAVVADVTLPRSGLEILIIEDEEGRLIFRFSSCDFSPSSSLVLTRRSLQWQSDPRRPPLAFALALLTFIASHRTHAHTASHLAGTRPLPARGPHADGRRPKSC